MNVHSFGSANQGKSFSNYEDFWEYVYIWKTFYTCKYKIHAHKCTKQHIALLIHLGHRINSPESVEIKNEKGDANVRFSVPESS